MNTEYVLLPQGLGTAVPVSQVLSWHIFAWLSVHSIRVSAQMFLFKKPSQPPSPQTPFCQAAPYPSSQHKTCPSPLLL